MVDIPGNSSTTRSITVGGTISDALEVIGDHDWFRISLTAGQSISVALDGISLEDSYLRIYNSSGQLLFENDDISAGVNRDSLLAFTANYSGTYYIDVGAWDEGYAGTYQLSVDSYSPPPVVTAEQFADQLVEGYWNGDAHHFNVTEGDTLTVNISALTAAGKTLALAALQTWTDIIGVEFVQVSSGGQIVFDDNQEGAFSDSNWSNGIISSSHVNVSTQWLADYGTGLDTYSFQTYIHEIGHALGLGHAGNYNGDARFPFDASFYNDAWPMSVMSYFSPTENTYFAGQGFTYSLLMTPMLADILAMSVLYGLSTTTRLGNTSYGSFATDSLFNANLYPNAAWTIYDSGGTDWLDYSSFSTNQTINLNPETFSNVAFGTGNLTIARGVVIENAVGGNGNDTLIGNGADNLLDGRVGNDQLIGGGGNDTVSYSNANSAVTIDLALAGAQNTGGAGTDTLSSIENVIGSVHADTLFGTNAANFISSGGGEDIVHGRGGNDTLTGSSYAQQLFGDDGNDLIQGFGEDDTLAGGAGNDTLEGGTGADTMSGDGDDDVLLGGDGDDVMNGGGGNDSFRGGLDQDSIDGGSGIDLVIYDDANAGITVNLATGTAMSTVDWNAQIGVDQLTDVENLIASNYGDVITGNGSGNTLYGMGGNDLLDGGAGIDQLIGGLGDDILCVDQASDVVTELAGEGTDEVRSSIAYVLGANLEHLTLTGVAAIAGTGNGLDNIVAGNGAANALSGLGGNDTLTGGGGNDELDGGTGRDTMAGGAGDDVYHVDRGDDVTTESAGQGVDTVISSVSHGLKANLENLTLTGSADRVGKGNGLANVITGNEGSNDLYGFGGADMLHGGNGNDLLDGGIGADAMSGGMGDDLYRVDNGGDTASENGGGGTDLVKSSVSFTLGAGLDNLTLIGTGTINGTGNGLNNVITGNSLANVLAGAAGADQLNGYARNDSLNGGEGDDLLNGGTGRDTMLGGLGDDSYQVDRGDDAAIEQAGEGIDTVLSTTSYVLKAHVEHLTLTGSLDRNGTGNALDNTITGNSGDNYLKGMDGNDVIDGGAGRDTLAGGFGADTFTFDEMLDFAGLDAASSENITRFEGAEGDRIDLSQLDANSLLDGDQGFSFLGSDPFTGSAGELRSYHANGDTFVEGDTNGDGTGDFLIMINGFETLQASDFLM